MIEIFTRTKSLYRANALRHLIFKCLIFHQKVRNEQLTLWIKRDELVLWEVYLNDIHVELISLYRQGLLDKGEDEIGEFFSITEDGVKYYNSGITMNQMLQSTQNTVFFRMQIITATIAIIALVSKIEQIYIVGAILGLLAIVIYLWYLKHKKDRRIDKS